MNYTIGFLTYIIGAYVLLCIILGFKDIGKIKTLKEFALGYKNISTAVLVATMYATHMGAGDTIGFIEQINNVGLACIIIIFGRQIGWYMTEVIYSRNLDRFQGCLSQAHIMQRLYGDFGFFMSNVINIFSCVTTTSIQIVVIGFVVQYFFGFSEVLSIFIGAFIVITYAASGGVKAVILTDVVQFLLFGVVIITAFLLVSKSVINAEDWFLSVPKSKLWIVPHDVHSFLLVAGMFVYSAVPVGQYTPFIQRILISGSDSQVRKVFSYVRYIDLIAMLGIGIIGIFLLKSTGEGMLDKAGIFEMINKSANPFIIAAAVMGILAVAMSTADSWLNAGSVIATEAIVKYLSPRMTDIDQVKAARAMTVILGSVGAFIGLFGKSIISIILIGFCFVDPLVCIPMAAGFLGYSCTEKDYKRAVVFALIGVFTGRFVEGDFGFITLLFGVIGSAIGLALPYKWSFRLPDDSSMFKLPNFNAFQPMFLLLVISLCLMYGLIHSYIISGWTYSDVSLFIGCIIFCVLGLSFKMYENQKLFKYSVQFSAITLVGVITAFIFKMDFLNVTCNIYLCITIFILIAHRLHYSIMCGMLVGIILPYALPDIALYSPNIPTVMLLLAFLTLSGFYLLIYNELTITKLTVSETAAMTDPMTGFYNMAYNYNSLFRVGSNSLSVIAIDIDSFKRFNDEYQSHDIGDLVLKTIADIIKERVRKGDVCIRRGGDEFIIILPRTSIEEAEIIAERIDLCIRGAKISIPQPPYITNCTISYGVDTRNAEDKTLWDVVKRADEMLYNSKGIKAPKDNELLCELKS